MATMQGSARRQRQQGSHMPLPLQGFDLEQYVKMKAAKMRYLNVLILRITFAFVQSSALLHGILKLCWKLAN